MKPERNFNVIENPALIGFHRAFQGFFRGLKEDFECSLFHLVKKFRGSCEKHRTVPVVPAGMKADGVAGLILKGQRIHVGTQQHHRTRLRPLFHSKHTGTRNAARDGVAHLFQRRRNVGARFKFLKTQFRGFVQVIPDRNGV